MERKWWTLLVVCAATFMLLLDVTIVTVALPDIQTALNTSFSDIQWVTDAYALTLAALLVTAGSLADLYGRKLLFLIGLVIFTLGSGLCGAAQNPDMLIVSRALQGVGGAILFATSLALLAASFFGKERGVAFGAWGAVTGIAAALGPILGGLITEWISWRGIFLVNLPIGVIALVITVREVVESRAEHASRPDWPGFVTFTVGLVALVYGLIRAGETSWGDSRVAVSLVIAAVFIVLFLVIEARVANPLFDLALLRTPTFDGGLIAAFAMNSSLFAMFLYLVLYLQNSLGYGPLGTGARLLLVSGLTMVTATIAGRLTGHVPARFLIGPGLMLVGVGLLLMHGISGTSSWTHLIIGFVVAGAGSGFVNPPLASTAIGVVPVQRAGMASGINTTFRQIGIAVGIAVYGSIFASTLSDKLSDDLAGNPDLAGKSGEISAAIRQGNPAGAIASVPANLQEPLGVAVHSAFAGAMNELFIVSGLIALVGGVLALLLIRQKDFVTSGPSVPGH